MPSRLARAAETCRHAALSGLAWVGFAALFPILFPIGALLGHPLHLLPLAPLERLGLRRQRLAGKTSGGAPSMEEWSSLSWEQRRREQARRAQDEGRAPPEEKDLRQIRANEGLALALANFDLKGCERLIGAGADPSAIIDGLSVSGWTVFTQNFASRWSEDPAPGLAIAEVLLRARLPEGKSAAEVLGEALSGCVGKALPTDLTRALLAAGANPNHESPQGLTPLLSTCSHFAIKREIIHALLDGGADASLASRSGGRTVLMQLARGYKRHAEPEGEEMARLEETIDRLIQSGAQIDALDEQGESALRHAMDSRSVALAEALLSRGANPALADRKGLRPLEAWEASGKAPGSEREASLLARLGAETERRELSEIINPAEGAAGSREARRL